MRIGVGGMRVDLKGMQKKSMALVNVFGIKIRYSVRNIGPE
jgi:hypothetical protein